MKTRLIPLNSRRVAKALITALFALSLFAQALWTAIPARAQGIDDPQVSFEGYLLAQGPSKWLVGNQLDGNRIIWVTPETVIIDKPYSVELGAWVSVMARRNSASELYAYLIQTERPAGAPGLPFEFVGKLEKIGDSHWLIDNTPVEVTSNTVISGVAQINAWVWVGAAIYPSGLRAERIQVLLQPSESGAVVKLVEIKGIIRLMAADQWVIGGHAITITPDTEINGTPHIGDMTECRAVQVGNDVPTATTIRVLGHYQDVTLAGSLAAIATSSAGGQLWDILVNSPWENPQTVQVQVNGNTWVDQSRAVVQTGQWIEMRGAPAGVDSYQADYVRVVQGAPATTGSTLPPAMREAGRPTQTFTTPWGSPTTVAAGLTSGSSPTLTFTPNKVAHAVWEAGGRLFYASKNPGAAWSAPALIDYGFAPYLIADTQGVLHLVYVNQFGGNFETYYISLTPGGEWSLPVNMSYTSGYSAQPKLAISSNNVLHAVWMDYTPGYWIIYHATPSGHFWNNRPIPSGRGQAPSIAAASDGAMYVVWQNQLPRDIAALGDFEVLLTELRNGYWDAPLNVSTSPGIHSIGADVTTTSDSWAHVVWVDGGEKVRYACGRGDQWSQPLTVSDALDTASKPRIVAEMGTYLHIAWDDVTTVRATATAENIFPWPTGYGYTLKNADSILRDITLALIPGGGVGLGWMQADAESGYTDIYASTRAPIDSNSNRLWVPLLIEPQ